LQITSLVDLKTSNYGKRQPDSETDKKVLGGVQPQKGY
jgi:hypothetical protein